MGQPAGEQCSYTTDGGTTLGRVATRSMAGSGTYNNLNQLTNLSGQALTWDANGNLLSDGLRTYAWDAENRLVPIPIRPRRASRATSPLTAEAGSVQ